MATNRKTTNLNPYLTKSMKVLLKEHSCLKTIVGMSDLKQISYLQLLTAHVKNPHVIPLLQQTIPGLNHLNDLCLMKLMTNVSDKTIESFCSYVLHIDKVGDVCSNIRKSLADYSFNIWKSYLCTKFTINSIIDWIHIVISIPSVEEQILIPVSDEDVGNLIFEYAETKSFQNIYKEIKVKHDGLGRLGNPIVIIYGDYIDKHEVFKGSCEAYMLHILNMKRKVHDLPYMQFLIAELPGNKEDIHIVRRALLSEQILLSKGIQMWVPSQKGLAWVYGICDLQSADTQEQYKNISCAAPGGLLSKFCCCNCMASRKDFAIGKIGRPRMNTQETQVLVETAVHQKSFTAAEKMLRNVGLMANAMVNPNLFLPVASISDIQGKDILHICLFDVRVPTRYLAKNSQLLPNLNFAILEQRIVMSHKLLLKGKKPSLICHCATWKSHESLSFILASPWIMDKFVINNSDCLKYFEFTATIHFLLTAPIVHQEIWSYLLNILYPQQRNLLQKWFPTKYIVNSIGKTSFTSSTTSTQPEREEKNIRKLISIAAVGEIKEKIKSNKNKTIISQEIISNRDNNEEQYIVEDNYDNDEDEDIDELLVNHNDIDDINDNKYFDEEEDIYNDEEFINEEPMEITPSINTSSTSTTTSSTTSTSSTPTSSLMRGTLNNHHVLHLADNIKHYGPLCLVSTQIFEHAQGGVAEFAGMKTKDSDEYAFKLVTSKQLHFLSQLHHCSAVNNETCAHLKEVTTPIQDFNKGKVRYYSWIFEPKAIIMQILDSWEPPTISTNDLPYIDELFAFYEVINVNTSTETLDVYLLKVPHSKLPFYPFPFKRESLEIHSLPFNSCCRRVAKVLQFKDSSSRFCSPQKWYILPTVFI